MIALAAMASGGHFDEVIAAIDKMMETLKKEEASDIEIKETCEKDRMEDSRKAAKTARTIDEESEEIFKLEAEIASIKAEVADKEAQIKKLDEELAEATKIREDEFAEWKQANSDDK